MKIWFRIGLGQGSGQDGLQSPKRYCPAHSMDRFLDPARFSGARFLRPFTLLAPRRKGKICEGGRFSGSRRPPRCPLAPTLLPPRHPGLKPGTSLGESGRFSDISNRFWPKNRSYRKQTIKPRLTGARMHIRHFGFLALFDNRFHASNRRTRLKNERGFRGCWRTSTRFCSKSRTL